jgi:hypothetical protein
VGADCPEPGGGTGRNMFEGLGRIPAQPVLSMELFLSKKDTYINWIRLFDLDRQLNDEPDISKSLESIPRFLSLQAPEQSNEPFCASLEELEGSITTRMGS